MLPDLKHSGEARYTVQEVSASGSKAEDTRTMDSHSGPCTIPSWPLPDPLYRP